LPVEFVVGRFTTFLVVGFVTFIVVGGFTTFIVGGVTVIFGVVDSFSQPRSVRTSPAGQDVGSCDFSHVPFGPITSPDGQDVGAFTHVPGLGPGTSPSGQDVGAFTHVPLGPETSPAPQVS
jgi:hypothetical protein